ncbi:MAG: ComF family protein [Clostridia bacterium]
MINLLELVYPNVCGFCNKICKNELCNRCKNKIKKYEINIIIEPQNRYFEELISIFKYEGIIREKIIQYKFGDKAYMNNTFAKIILKNEKICGLLKKYDIIIPVPIHKKRKAQRGYNQTQLIANKISKCLNIKLCNNVLVKNKNTIAQSKLNKKKRVQNIKGAFKILNSEKIKGKDILLLDDIYTTGSTANECSKILKKAGAKTVGVLTIAKD